MARTPTRASSSGDVSSTTRLNSMSPRRSLPCLPRPHVLWECRQLRLQRRSHTSSSPRVAASRRPWATQRCPQQRTTHRRTCASIRTYSLDQRKFRPAVGVAVAVAVQSPPSTTTTRASLRCSMATAREVSTTTLWLRHRRPRYRPRHRLQRMTDARRDRCQTDSSLTLHATLRRFLE